MTSAPTEKQTMKASKPAMEKRRRARINESLQELKALVLDGVNKNNSRHSKLEKADILEMTVRYLRNVQRQQVKTSVDVDPTVLTKYRSGFAECMGEVSRYLGGSMEENTEVRARLLGHLAGLCTTQQNHGQQPVRYAVGAQAETTGTNHMQPSPKPTGTSQGLVAVTSAADATPISSVQPYYMNFPTPPASAGHPPKVGRQTTLVSPRVEGTRTGCGPQAPAVQNIQLPVKCDAPATPKAEVPVSGANRQSVIIAQNLPTRAAPRSIHSGDMITLVLPSQSLPGGQVPTHLIPVYASTANTSTSSPGFSFSNPGHAVTLTSERAGNDNCGAVHFSFASSSNTNTTSIAPATITVGQQAAWTAIPVPTVQIVSPQAGTVAPSAIPSPFAISFPFNAEISPPRLPTQDKPREQMGRPIQLSGVFQNYEMSGDDDPMWRPW